MASEREDKRDESDGDRLLIYAPVPLCRRADGELLLDAQACNGVRLWADNFAWVTVMLPVVEDTPGPEWVPVDRVGSNLTRIEFVSLPSAFRPDRFLAEVPRVVPRIREVIDRSDYLSFAIGGLFGDWGAVACLVAHRLRRPYAVWTDRVESEVVRSGAGSGPWRHRVRARLTHRPMASLERAVIRRAGLGLFHGRETYDAYARYCTQPAVVHDIHVSASDHIAPDALAAKISAAGKGPLRICYVGRADPMKGPLDWVRVLEQLAATGIDFRALWLGDGSERPAMQRRLESGGLLDRVSLPGFAVDRAAVLGALSEAHIFLFCHKTPESPRCLIEALISGCPIVGYDGAFARDLIAGHQGGVLTPRNDVTALGDLVAALAVDRSLVADLIGRAASDGAPFTAETVFRHRSELIRAFLPFVERVAREETGE
jgi:glycosyltransferase involved in cell wall biosynthesis